MVKKLLFSLSVLLVLFVSACSTPPRAIQAETEVPQPTTELPTRTPTSVPTSTPLPSATPTDPPTPEPLWTPIPPDMVASLETLTGWIYPTPLVNCAQRIREENDLQHSCSTEQRQSVAGWLTIPDRMALVLTGDEFTLTYDEAGHEPFAVSPAVSPHRLWVIPNNSGEDVRLYLDAPHGVFIGWFEPTDGVFHQRLIAHLRNLHLNRFLIGPQPRDYQPTPVANCDSPEGCDDVEIVVAAILNGGEIRILSYGFYDEFGDPYWQPEAPPVLGIP